MSTFGGVSGGRLRQFIEQVEYLEEQKAALASDMREVFAEAKSAGFDVKVIRQILKIRKMDQDEFQEQEAVLETYLQALRMSSGSGSSSDTSSVADDGSKTVSEDAGVEESTAAA